MKDINLLPDDIRNAEDQFKTQTASRPAVKVIWIVIASIVLVAVTFVLPKVWIITLNTQLDMTNEAIQSATYNEVKSITRNMGKLEQKINSKNQILTVIDNETISIAQVLNIISTSTPEGCTLESVNLTDNVLFIEGKVNDGGKASELLSNIRRINSLSVSNTSVESKEGYYTFKYNFTISRKGGN